jgi:hypothetical protein
VAKAYYGRSQTGAHVYVYSDGPNWARFNLRYKVQPPGGGWSEEKTFFENGDHNSYPTLIENSPGEYYCVWDSGTPKQHRTHIRFGVLKLDKSK